MISLEECRKILGNAGHGLSDAALDRLRQQLYGLADIAVTCFLTRKAEGVTFPSEEPPTAKPGRGAARRPGNEQRRDEAGSPETVEY